MSIARILLAAFTLLLASSCSHSLSVPAEIATLSPEESLVELTSSPWRGGNLVTPLHNGEEFYPAMLDSILAAEHSITFETFAFVSGPITYQFAKALAEKANSGVAVHIILDAIGSKDAGPCLEILKKSSAQVILFRPPLSTSPLKINSRDHRKILITDGHTLYTGGAGFAESWTGNGRSPGQWRDSQFQLRGPSVHDWQQAFANHWENLTNEKLSGDKYFPVISAAGKDTVQSVMDSASHSKHPIGTSILYSIQSARHKIDLQQSYFIPTKEITNSLIKASQRGVKVRILTPSSNIDFPLCRTASRIASKQLILAGIEIYEYQPSMMHAKIMLVDDNLSIIGSGNLDPRTFFINLESNLHVRSNRLVRDLRDQFDKDLSLSKRIKKDETGWHWQASPQQFVAWSLRHQL